MTTILQRPQPNRDRWGRYMLPVPGKPKPVAHTRVTTLVKACDDTSNLAKWQCRMTAIGLTSRPDLRALVASHQDDKATLNRACDDAIEAAKAGAAANTGTALHRFCELADAGVETDFGEWAPDVNAYQSALATAGLTVIPELMERIVRVPGLLVAGTFDRVVELDGQRYVADIKTGSIEYGQLTISAQLACYARGELWDGADGYQPLDVDQTTGLIIHLPAGQARCELVWVDLTAGWEIAQLCHTVRSWRKRNDLFTPFSQAIPPFPNTPAPVDRTIDERRDWLRSRVAQLSSTGRAHLNAIWPAHVPKGADQPWTHTQIDAVTAAVDAAEKAVEAPFQPPDPATVAEPVPPPQPQPKPQTEDDDRKVAAGEYQRLKTRFQQSPARELVQAWADQARQAGRSLAIANTPTALRCAVFDAALSLAPHGDQAARDLIGSILGEALGETHSTGWALSALRLTEAQGLKRLARELSLGHLKLTFTDDGTPVAEVTGPQPPADPGDLFSHAAPAA